MYSYAQFCDDMIANNDIVSVENVIKNLNTVNQLNDLILCMKNKDYMYANKHKFIKIIENKVDNTKSDFNQKNNSCRVINNKKSNINNKHKLNIKLELNTRKNNNKTQNESIALCLLDSNLLLNETTYNEDGKVVPKFCKKCGFVIGTFMHGEPVYKCTNKECDTYYGVVKFPK